MNSSFYLPVLKSKAGEFDALFKLENKFKESVVPLLEITPIEWDNSTSEKPKTIEKHLTNFCNKMFKKWPINATFIDTHLINDTRPDGLSSIEYIVKKLYEKKIIPMPVVRTSSSLEFLSDLNWLFIMYPINEIGIRLTIEDLMHPETESKLHFILDKISVNFSQCHLIIDLHGADFNNIDDFSDAILQVLDFSPYLNNWKTLTICGGAFPATSSIKAGNTLIPRNDWLLYKKIIEKLRVHGSKLRLNFGDYGIVAPGYFEFDPRKMSRSANIRYTYNDEWLVIKGSALKTSADFQQYIKQANLIVKSKYYLGETFSAGDSHLKKCANGEASTGTPTVWNWVGNNHHFSKVVLDLNAIRFGV